jgi:hypothetical protein
MIRLNSPVGRVGWKGETIQWIVDSVDAAQDIFEEQLLDGTEVHSRLFRVT